MVSQIVRVNTVIIKLQNWCQGDGKILVRLGGWMARIAFLAFRSLTKVSKR